MKICLTDTSRGWGGLEEIGLERPRGLGWNRGLFSRLLKAPCLLLFRKIPGSFEQTWDMASCVMAGLGLGSRCVDTELRCIQSYAGLGGRMRVAAPVG